MSRSTLDLAGRWRFALDPRDEGLRDGWYRGTFRDSLQLPGSLQAQGFGNRPGPKTVWTSNAAIWKPAVPAAYRRFDRPGRYKTTLWLQPEREYVGAAWYQRDLVIPANWLGHRIELSLERCHGATTVWLDDRQLGAGDSLCTPHVHVLPAAIFSGRHRLTIRADNRVTLGVGLDAHSVSDHTQTNWNGVIGRIALTARPTIRIAEVAVSPSAGRRTARVNVRIENATGEAARVRIEARARSYNHPGKTHRTNQAADATIPAGGGTVSLVMTLGAGAPRWDEFSPALYRLTVDLESDAGHDAAGTTFGLRDFRATGTRFMINGRPVFLRGTLECAIFPKTGYPPTGIPAWRRIFNRCRQHGLNHVRFHSWCPPEAAFTAADEAGVYLHVESPCWATVGDGAPIDRWIHDETERILAAFGNHPSFVMMAYGNEPGGTHRDAYLNNWVETFRRRDPRRVWTSGAGWPEVRANQYHVIPDPRIHHWMEGLNSRLNAKPPETTTDYARDIRKRTVPVVAHEIGQWCVFPNFDEMKKYTGLLRPRNFEAFREILTEHGMGRLARDYLMASGRLQTLCYKEEIESALRTKGYAGFQLLDLHDFPGQGTALVGVLDPFWDPKPYHSPTRWARFCGPTVPLTRMAKRSWMEGETFRAALEVAHFGPRSLPSTAATWRLWDDSGRAVRSGVLPARRIPVGNGIRLGPVSFPLKGLDIPSRYRFEVKVGTAINDWDLWVFPNPVEAETDGEVYITRSLDAGTLAWLRRGGRVLLCPDPARVHTGGAVLGFTPVFWNTCFTNNQPPHTLGVLCDPRHPALRGFPTAPHTDWQWWDLVAGASAICLDPLAGKVDPLVRIIDTWYDNRRLALAFEARVGKGRLVVCASNLLTDLDRRPAARQFRYSLLTYMRSPRFTPRARLTAARIAKVVGPA